MNLLALAANTLLGDAAAPYVLLGGSNRYIGTLIPDVTVREVQIDEDVITVHPVESGTPISDHVFANPKVIEIACGFSDSTAGFTGYVRQVYEAFLAQKAQREPFPVSTGKRAYKNMLFSSITVVTDETSENVLQVTARLQEVIITQTATTGADQGKRGNPASTGATTDKGGVTPKAAPNADIYRAYEAPTTPNTIYAAYG